MATIAGILEGKSGNFFKLEDLGDDAFIVTESIDPKKTDIRVEKVPNKNKKEGERDDTEYYHILGKLGDQEKDLSLTFTALKQLAAVMPRDDNWRGYPIKFLGKKGSGKNIKYNYQVLGKVAVEQMRLPTKSDQTAADITTPAGKLLFLFSNTPAGLTDKAFWDYAVEIFGSVGAASEAVGRLKNEGRLVQDKEGMWRAK